MNLVVDSGNTLCKVALFSGGKFLRSDRTSNLTAAFLDHFLGFARPTQIFLSSVRATGAEERGLLSAYGDVMTFAEAKHIPLKIAYATPQTLGSDRIAAAVYAVSQFPGENVCVIIVGSCITADLVTADGIYQGGTISPGPEMRLHALHFFTGNLPEPEFVPVETLPETSTAACIQAGVFSGVLAEIEYYIRYYRQHFPGLHVIVSGGFISSFEKKINYPIFAQNDIVLKGLNLILNYNIEHTEK
ncbi:MAG TPA: type III pantothenate kinase [Bacteroidales bacterium]|nr:type III pantothenate kinase [Bacteroidales bacterium]